MKILITVDGLFKRTPDGKVWIDTIYSNYFWKRYLQVFDKVRVAGRIEDVESVDDSILLASCENVEFYPLTQYRGPIEYIKKYLKLIQSANNIVDGCDCVLFRIPSPIANIVEKQVKNKKIPYAIELVNDPWDTFRPGAYKSIIRPIVRILLTKQCKRMAAKANGASYVTKLALQERYPARARIIGESDEAFESFYSSISLKRSFITEKKIYGNSKSIILVHTNSCITDFSKGHHIVIDTIKILCDKGYDCKCIFIGDGPKRGFFQNYADKLGVGKNIEFTGLLCTQDEVKKKLMNADIFLLPTTGEGLPRCIIEAMAVGLPCLATGCNGIPELLSEDCLMKLNGNSYADKIIEWVNNPELMNEQSERNISKAAEYCEDILNNRRVEFYEKLNKLSLNNDKKAGG